MSRGGTDLTLRRGGYTADLTTVGAGVRALRHRDRPLLLAYPVDAVRPAYRGALLAPWPNRMADGRYTFDGRRHHLPLTEPERRTALHGLVVWERFEVAERTDDAVELRHRVVPREGYPFDLDLTVLHRLGDDGLTTTVTARNVGERPLPYGVAPHPYLRAGSGRVDGWTLRLPAARVLEVTPDRLLPVAVRRVDGGPLDFRAERRIGDTALDHAFTGLAADGDGLVRVDVVGDDRDGGDGGDGHGSVRCEWDPAVLPWVQVHTADLPGPDRSRLGLAVEPMTCPPDAFNSRADLVVLEPAASHSAWWRLRADSSTRPPPRAQEAETH